MECGCKVESPGPSLAGCGSYPQLFFMTLMEHILSNQCDVIDPCGRPLPCYEPLPSYDFIVVGGGTAGSVVASRLSEVHEWKVLLIEAGPNEPISSQVPSFWGNTQKTTVDWQYWTEPEPTACLGSGGSCRWVKGKVIGGSSSISPMNYVRGNKKDYDDWEGLGNTGWSYKNVLPYFKKSEDNKQIDQMDEGFHGVGGPQPVSFFPYHYPIEQDVVEGARELGHRVGDLNGEEQIGFSIAQAFSNDGIRYSAARSFLKPARNRTNLHVLFNTLVVKVLVDSRTKIAYGVETLSENGELERYFTRKEVVVCGGTVSSPHILMLSGIGDEDDLRSNEIPLVHSLPGVGRNLHSHVSYLLMFNTNEPDINDLTWDTANEYLKSRSGPLSATGLAAMGFIQTKYGNNSKQYPDVQFQFGVIGAQCSKGGNVFDTSGDIEHVTMPLRQLFMCTSVLQPRSRGFITLKDNNPLSYPKIFPRYFTDPEDILPIIEGINYLITLSKTKALSKYGLQLDRDPVIGCENEIFGSDKYWECAIRTDTLAINHQVGTCKMGPDGDPLAVVDSQLRVRGVGGLRVVDASVIPIVPAGNTNAPTMMIAEKASDIIKNHWNFG